MAGRRWFQKFKSPNASFPSREMIMKVKERIRSKISPPNPASPSLDLEAGQSVPDPQPASVEQEQPIPDPQPAAFPDPQPYRFDWGGIVIGLCFTSAVEIALQSLQPHILFPPLMHLLSLALFFAFASVFVSNFISPNFPDFAHALTILSKLSIFTAFIFAITIPFSLTLKLISWSIFAASLLLIAFAAAAATFITGG